MWIIFSYLPFYMSNPTTFPYRLHKPYPNPLLYSTTFTGPLMKADLKDNYWIHATYPCHHHPVNMGLTWNNWWEIGALDYNIPNGKLPWQFRRAWIKSCTLILTLDYQWKTCCNGTRHFVTLFLLITYIRT